MNRYTWWGIRIDGSEAHGVMRALGPDEVRQELFNRGVALLSVRREWRDAIRQALRRWRGCSEQRAFLMSSLAMLLRSGVPLVEALTITARRLEDNALASAVLLGARDVSHGSSLSTSWKHQSHLFPAFMIQLIAAGEHVGALASAFEMIAEYEKKNNAVARQVRGAAFFPLLTAVGALCVVGAVLFFVVPQFATFFNAMERDLPEGTLFVLWLSDFIQSDLMIVSLGMIFAVGLALRFLLRNNRKFHEVKDMLVVRCGMVGNVIVLADLNRYFRVLCMLLKAGQPLNKALCGAQLVVANSGVRRALSKTVTTVERGVSYTHALRDVPSQFFPPHFIDLIAIGEQAGMLTSMIERSIESTEQELKYKTKMLVSFVQPILLLIVGLCVAALLYAVYSPIFAATTLIS